MDARTMRYGASILANYFEQLHRYAHFRFRFASLTWPIQFSSTGGSSEQWSADLGHSLSCTALLCSALHHHAACHSELKGAHSAHSVRRLLVLELLPIGAATSRQGGIPALHGLKQGIRVASGDRIRGAHWRLSSAGCTTGIC